MKHVLSYVCFFALAQTCSALASDISAEAGKYRAVTAEEKARFDPETLVEIATARARYLCHSVANQELDAYAITEGSNSQGFTILLDSKLRPTGHLQTGIEYIYPSRNGLIQSNYFSKVLCVQSAED